MSTDVNDENSNDTNDINNKKKFIFTVMRTYTSPDGHKQTKTFEYYDDEARKVIQQQQQQHHRAPPPKKIAI